MLVHLSRSLGAGTSVLVLFVILFISVSIMFLLRRIRWFVCCVWLTVVYSNGVVSVVFLVFLWLGKAIVVEEYGWEGGREEGRERG